MEDTPPQVHIPGSLQLHGIEDYRVGGAVLLVGLASLVVEEEGKPIRWVYRSIEGHVCKELPKEPGKDREPQNLVLNSTDGCELCGIVVVDIFNKYQDEIIFPERLEKGLKTRIVV